MSLMRWEPFNDLISLREAMDRLFEESFVRPRGVAVTNGTLTLPLEVYQTEDEVVVKAPVPGVRPEDIDVNVLGDTLTIKGEIKEEKAEKASHHLREWRNGVFARTITLPAPVNADQAQATFERGVLTLRLPKAQSARPRQIKVESAQK